MRSPWIADLRCWTRPKDAIPGADQTERSLWRREWWFKCYTLYWGACASFNQHLVCNKISSPCAQGGFGSVTEEEWSETQNWREELGRIFSIVPLNRRTAIFQKDGNLLKQPLKSTEKCSNNIFSTLFNVFHNCNCVRRHAHIEQSSEQSSYKTMFIETK